MADYEFKGYCTAEEARKVLAKAKRNKKKPYPSLRLSLYTDKNPEGETIHYYDHYDSLEVSWPQAEKILNNIYESQQRGIENGKPRYIDIRIMDRILFIG